MFQVSQLAEAEPGLKVCLGASGSEGHTLVSVPRCLWRDRHNLGVSGQTLPPTPQCGAGPEFFPGKRPLCDQKVRLQFPLFKERGRLSPCWVWEELVAIFPQCVN